MIGIALVGTALAGSIFVNGVYVDGIRNQTFEGASVTIDAEGNVRISAPGYRIEVVDPPATQAARTNTTTATQATYTPAAPPPRAQAVASVPKGQWWLVTEDNGSVGHVVEIFVNGHLVHTLRSGDTQIIVDVGEFLRPGNNDVLVRSTSGGAGGGSLYVYLGEGSNLNGELQLQTPQVQYGLGGSRQGTNEKQYTLIVGS